MLLMEINAGFCEYVVGFGGTIKPTNARDKAITRIMMCLKLIW
jgi:hypothetical protein